MADVRTRGISLVRTVEVAGPNRKEPQYVQRQFMVRCNASIPLSHKDFQNQYLYEDNAEERIQAPKPKKPQQKLQNKKLNKWKRELL